MVISGDKEENLGGAKSRTLISFGMVLFYRLIR
jgi:hypothetical protein